MTGKRWTEPLEVPDGFNPYRLIELIDGNAAVGDVMWWFDKGPFYPHTHNQRFGAFGTLEAAKACVEKHCLGAVMERDQ